MEALNTVAVTPGNGLEGNRFKGKEDDGRFPQMGDSIADAKTEHLLTVSPATTRRGTTMFRSTFRATLKTATAIAISLFTFALPAQAAKPGTEEPAVRNPILFVHGYASDGSIWSTMKDRFQADGWPADELAAFSYNYNQSNATTAEEVRDQVQSLLASTGADQVDIITHSMGGLSSRHFLKFMGGDELVEAWVSLAGPNHGTSWAYGCLSWSCFEMRPGSSFLDELNKGKETPGDTRYGTWWSSCDEIINPDDSVVLKGADNNRTACISHNWFLYDGEVYRDVRDWID